MVFQKVVVASENIVRKAAQIAALDKAARSSAKQSNAVFVWIPKSAGTSTLEMLKPHGFVKLKRPWEVKRHFRNQGRVTFGHMDIQALTKEGLVDSSYLENAFKFCIVRNPYDRAVSLYNYLKTRPAFLRLNKVPRFREWLELLDAGLYDRIGLYNQRGLSQCNPQCRWVVGLHDVTVYRLDRLDQAVADLENKLDAPGLKVRHVNRSTGISRRELDKADRQIIEKVYREDFDTFDFERER